MANKNFLLRIRTPEQEVFEGEVEYLNVITESGTIIILPNHASLTTTLMLSPITFKYKNTEESYVAKRGILSISQRFKTVDLMVMSCQKKSEMDYYSAKEYLDFIEKELRKGKDISAFKMQYLKEEKIVLEKEMKLMK